MKTLFYLLLASLVVVFSSCEKDTEAFLPHPSTKKSAPTEWAEAANPANPYESIEIGHYHNSCLEYYKNSISLYDSLPFWYESRYQITLDYFCSITDPTYCNQNTSLRNLLVIDSIALDSGLFINELNILSSTAKSEALELLGYFDSFNISQFSALKNSIVSQEADIENHTSIPLQEKKMLLLACQVARYSALYWKEEIEDDCADWGFMNGSHIEWAETVDIDIRGAIVGYLFAERIGLNPIDASMKGAPTTSKTKATQPPSL